MRQIITTAFCLGLTLAATAAPVERKVVGTNFLPAGEISTRVQSSESKLPEVQTLGTLTRAAAADVTARFTIDESKEQYVYAVIAVPADCNQEGHIASTPIDKTTFGFSLPAGKYDFMSIVDCEAADRRVFLIKEGVEIEAGETELEFNVADAAYSTRISHVDSEGNVLALPSYTEPSNCTCGDFIDIIYHNGLMCWAGETLAYMECNYILDTNVADSSFSFLRLDVIGAEPEVVSYTIPVDFTQEVCGPTSSEGWQVSDQTFAPTPFDIAYDNYYKDVVGRGRTYTYASRGLIKDGQWWGDTGLGIFDMVCNSARVALWAPEGYDGAFDVCIFPSANVFSGDDSSFQGLPLRRGENGLKQIGLNFGAGNKIMILASDAEGQSLARQNSRYAVEPDGAQLGNCAPLFQASNHFSKLSFTYKGRHGEDMSLDAYNILSSMDDEKILAALGGQPCDVKIYVGDKEICSSINDLPWDVDWQTDKIHKGVFTMKNVLIDGTIPGSTTAVVNWNPDKGNGFAPTFTSLQFRNQDGKVNDRFENASDGIIEFTVADLTLEYNDEGEYAYYTIGAAPKTVRAEYAVHGSEDFSPIEVSEVPDMYFNPGYGYYYTGSLACVDKKSADGWFDLRLYSDNEDGATVEQVISPAFHISGLSGIENVESDSFGYRIDGNNIIVGQGYRIYTATGIESKGRNLAAGVYVITDGIRARKVVIR